MSQSALEIIENMPYHAGGQGLESVRALLHQLGNPQNSVTAIHIAGTNGKGSVCAYVNQILMEAGYNVGLFVSPFLVRFNERIQINNTEIPDEDLEWAVAETYEALKKSDASVAAGMSQFRFITAVAFLYFKRKNVDVAVIETGLGGRYDSTNVVTPIISGITSIGYDHMSILGDTIEEIAYDKAGIIKEGIDAVIYPQPYSKAREVLLAECKKKNSEAHDLSDGKIDIKVSEIGRQVFDYELNGKRFENMELTMSGEYQVANACTAIELVASLKQFKITEEHIRNGLKKTRWQGRFEIISREPAIIVDGAHNPDGMEEFVKAYKALFSQPAVLVVGFTTGHEHKKIIDIITQIASKVVLTAPSGGKTADPEKLTGLFPADIEVSVIPEPDKALEFACKQGGIVAVTGSLYLVGDIKRHLQK